MPHVRRSSGLRDPSNASVRPTRRTSSLRPAGDRDSLQALQRTIGNRAMGQLLRQPTQAKDPPAKPPTKLPGNLRVIILGHASPRWKGAKNKKDADDKNYELSVRRMDEVEKIVNVRLRSLLGDDANIIYERVYYPGQPRVGELPGEARLEGHARGSRDSLRHAKGNRSSDDPAYRRVDVIIDDVARTEHYKPSYGTERRTMKSTRWGVTIGVSAGVTAGAAGTLLAVRLTNLETKRTGDYHLIAGGGGAKVGIGVSAPFDDSYTEFQTSRPVGFEDFDGVLTRYTSASIGLVFVGYERAYITFLGMGSGAESIDVGGFNYGAKLELGGSVTAGKLSMSGGARGMDDYTVPTLKDNPYEKRDEKSYAHSAYFETESALLSPSRRTDLRKYVNASAARFQGAPR